MGMSTLLLHIHSTFLLLFLYLPSCFVALKRGKCFIFVGANRRTDIRFHHQLNPKYPCFTTGIFLIPSLTWVLGCPEPTPAPDAKPWNWPFCPVQKATWHSFSRKEESIKRWEMLVTKVRRVIKSWEGKSHTIGDDANSKDAVDMITFNLQQVLPTPHLHINIAFYLRQLSVYNCGVHSCVTNQGYMFAWDETTAKRGSSEIVSCLSKYLTEFKSGARLVPFPLTILVRG